MHILFSILFTISSLSSTDLQPIDCSYQFMGMPFSQVQIALNEDGSLQDFVTVIVQGRAHRESFTLETPSSEELLHGWISKESSENSLEMVVYREMKPAGRSKLVNHRVPFGKEVWGNCE